jgi:hypothetical protein
VKPREHAAAGAAVACSAAAFAAVLVGLAAGGASVDVPWAPTLGLRLNLALDGLGVLYALLATGIGMGASGFVEIPRDGRSDRDVALWGLVTGEAPDEIVVDVDEERDVLVVHLTDARDPDAVRARHRRDLEQRRGKAAS